MTNFLKLVVPNTFPIQKLTLHPKLTKQHQNIKLTTTNVNTFKYIVNANNPLISKQESSDDPSITNLNDNNKLVVAL